LSQVRVETAMSSVLPRLLLFAVQGDRYALELQSVAEVLPPACTFPVPWTPSCIRGAMNFHGNLVAVLDLADFMGDDTMSAEGNFLVLDRSIANLALGVDRVETIIAADLVIEERDSCEPLVEKILVLADGEVRKLALEKLLENIVAAVQR
jgi:purine-binding chemotaxis protein CheW